MLLADWLAENEITKAAAARLFGCSRVSVHYYATGQMRPGATICASISKHTDGQVNADDHQAAFMAGKGAADERSQ